MVKDLIVKKNRLRYTLLLQYPIYTPNQTAPRKIFSFLRFDCLSGFPLDWHASTGTCTDSVQYSTVQIQQMNEVI